jgi:nucleoside-diphosphate-sugar epimerase
VEGAKVLVTGAGGQLGFPLVEHLAHENEVWGIARFADAAARDKVEAAGATTRAIDLASGDFGDLPDDFDYVIHLATFRGGGVDYDAALRTDAEGTALLLAHCRNARAALVMSAGSVYRLADDPSHAYVETDPLGEGSVPSLPTYSVSKITEEAAARACARIYDLPVVITRMNSGYGAMGGMPAWHLDAIMAGQSLPPGARGTKYSPIHQDDINVQTQRMLAAAAVPATIVNWGGDDVVGPDDWCPYLGELTGKNVEFGADSPARSYPSCIYDVMKRQSITGPCDVSWREGMRRTLAARYPGAA